MGLKFFSLFLGQFHSGLDRNNARLMFFNFFNFFPILFLNFLAQAEKERNSGLKFFSLFLDLSNPVLDRNNAGMMFFSIFLKFFTEFSCPGWVGTEFGTKIFFSLSRPISSQFGLKENEGMVFFNFFSIFFGIFLSGSSWNEYGTKFFSLSFSSYLTPV